MARSGGGWLLDPFNLFLFKAGERRERSGGQELGGNNRTCGSATEDEEIFPGKLKRYLGFLFAHLLLPQPP